MANTIKTYVSDGVRTSYPVDFTLGYLNDRSFVYVYQGDDPTIQLSYTWTDDENINLDAPVPSGEEFNIRRIVPRTRLINDYVDGAQIRERNLDQSYSQALMIIEEIEDGYIIDQPDWVIKQNLDMLGFSIVNAASIQADVIIDASGNDWYAVVAQAVIDAQLAEANAAGSAVAAQQSANDAAVLYDDFNDRYYGPYAADPIAAPSGAASTQGDLYFNTTSLTMLEYTGSAWQPISTGATNWGGIAGNIDDQGDLNAVFARTDKDEQFDAPTAHRVLGGALRIVTPGAVADADLNSYIEYYNDVGARKAWLGYGVSGNTELTLANDIGRVIASDTTGVGGVWHDGNSVRQADKADNTPDRVLLVGAWGIGGTQPRISGTDLNTLTTGGFFNGEQLANAPNASAGWFYVRVYAHGGEGYVLQEVTDLTSATPTTYIRAQVGGVWHPYRRVLDASQNGNANWVSQWGVNANGHFAIWTDGRKECWGRKIMTNGGTYGFPTAFVDAASITGLITRAQSGHVYEAGMHNYTTTTFLVSSGNAGGVNYNWYATGY